MSSSYPITLSNPAKSVDSNLSEHPPLSPTLHSSQDSISHPVNTIHNFPNFFSTNYHIRKWILGFLSFYQLKQLLFFNKQLTQDILCYLKTDISKLQSCDTITFCLDSGYSQFFSVFGNNLRSLSLYCLGVDLLTVLDVLPKQLTALKLICCSSKWLNERQFYNKLSAKTCDALESLQFHIIHGEDNHVYHKEHLNSSSYQEEQSDKAVISIQFLHRFWQSFVVLSKLSFKEMLPNEHTPNSFYNRLMHSVFTSQSLKQLKVLKLHNMTYPLFFIEPKFYLESINQQSQEQQEEQLKESSLTNQREEGAHPPVQPNSYPSSNASLLTQQQLNIPSTSSHQLQQIPTNNFQSLRYLKISTNGQKSNLLGINDRTIRFLLSVIPSTLQSLQLIDQQYAQFLQSLIKSISEPTFHEFLLHFQTLSNLEINSYRLPVHLSHFSLMQMIETFSELRQIGLASCNNINNGLLSQLVGNNASKLQELCMDYTQLDGALEVLVQQDVQLTRISINYCRRISKQEIISFFSHQKNLTHVSVQMLKPFTKKALIPLVQLNSTTLKDLNLEGNKIDNTHIAYLLRYCRNLVSLSLRKMDKIHNNFTNQLFYCVQQYGIQEGYDPTLERLKWLDLSYNASFNDYSLKNIHILFPQIQTLKLIACCSIIDISTFLPLRGTLTSLNVSMGNLEIFSHKQFEDCLEIIKKFPSLNMLNIEIPHMKEYLIKLPPWDSKPLLIHESFNQTTYALFKSQ